MFTGFSGKGEDIPAEGQSSIKPRKRWDDEGVASTVGTIMSLMVFLAFLSMFTNQYIPVWMEENESSHMVTANGQFSNLKQAIDLQILVGTISGSSPVEVYTPITLGANGIPIFAAPTAGYLGAYKSMSYDNVSFYYNINTTASPVYKHHRSPQPSSTLGGVIRLECPNRYYVPQTLIYENDAIILKQGDGEYMKNAPQFFVQRSGGKFDISYTQVDLRGDDFKYVGFGTRGVGTRLSAVSSLTYTSLTDYLYINHTTRYDIAWNTTFDAILSGSGMSEGIGNDYYIETIDIDVTNPLKPFRMVSLRINSNAISQFTLTTAHIGLITSETGVS